MSISHTDDAQAIPLTRIVSPPPDTELYMDAMSEAESDDVPIAMLYSNGARMTQEDYLRTQTRQFLASLERSGSVDSQMSQPPAWTPSQPPPAYSPKQQSRLQTKSSNLALGMVSVDLALNMTLVLLTLLMNLKWQRLEPVSLSIALIYLISSFAGNVAFLRGSYCGMQAYTLIFVMRILMDIVSLSWIFVSNPPIMFASPFTLIFSLPVAGIRAILPMLFPCFESVIDVATGYCSDIATIQGSPLNCFYIYVAMVFQLTQILPHIVAASVFVSTSFTSSHVVRAPIRNDSLV
jgi:hypothetical protein